MKVYKFVKTLLGFPAFLLFVVTYVVSLYIRHFRGDIELNHETQAALIEEGGDYYRQHEWPIFAAGICLWGLLYVNIFL